MTFRIMIPTSRHIPLADRTIKAGRCTHLTGPQLFHRPPVVVEEARRWALTNGVMTGAAVDDDAQFIYEHSVENGTRTRSPPVQIPQGLQAGWYTMGVYDSESIIMELMEQAKEAQRKQAAFSFGRGWLQPMSILDVVGDRPAPEVTVTVRCVN